MPQRHISPASSRCDLQLPRRYKYFFGATPLNIPLPFSPRSSAAQRITTTLSSLPMRTGAMGTNRSQFGGSSTWLHVILVVAAAFLVAPYFGMGAYLSSPSHQVEHAEDLDTSEEALPVAPGAVSDRRSKPSQQEDSAPLGRAEDTNDLSDLDELLAR